VIRHHHEKMDGSGYPDGLRGEAIPLKARILQIADIYDALTTNRPYRGALPPEEALHSLHRSRERLARCIRGVEVLADLQIRRELPDEGKNYARRLLRVVAHRPSVYSKYMPPEDLFTN